MAIPARPVRTRSHQTRGEILQAARRLFGERGFADVSIQQVATEAGVFPNQVTYHFGGKDGLFVEVATHLILQAGREAELAAQAAPSARTYIRSLAHSLLGPGLPALLVFVEAILIARRRPNLAPQIKAALDRLEHEGAAVRSELFASRRWRTQAGHDLISRSFWATTIGVALRLAANGTARIDADTLTLFDHLIDDQTAIRDTN